jgi:hypothetical protein
MCFCGDPLVRFALIRHYPHNSSQRKGDNTYSGGISLGDRPKHCSKTVKPTKVLNDHRQELATYATSMAVGGRGAARTEARAKITEIVPIRIRSAGKELLNAIEPKMKLRIRENRAVIRSTRCRTPRAMLVHDQTASTRQKRVSSTNSHRLLSIPWRKLISASTSHA